MRHQLGKFGAKCGSLLRRFRHDSGGNVAIITAVAAVPLLLAAGVAIDTARWTRSENALQVAVDAAALAVAASEKFDMAGLSDADKAKRKKELEDMARNFIKANYHDEGQDVEVSINVTDEVITVEGKKPYPTTLMNLGGIESVALSARAEVNTQGGIAENIEIALVMDTTGSMKGDKLAAAKAAAKALIQKVLGDAPSDAKIKLALVPFSGSVNVGADKRASGWIDTTGKASVSKVNFTSTTYHNMQGWDDLKYRNAAGQTVKLPWNGCVEARLGDLAINDTPPAAATPNTLFTPYFAPDEPDSFGSSGNNYVNYESGSESKRMRNEAKYANKVVDPSKPSNDGPWYNCAASAIVPLTNIRADIETGIDAMEARGNTNLPEGMAWGWRVLSPALPYTEGKSFTDKEWRKVIVFMTDGENDVGTNNDWSLPPSAIGTRYTSYGYSSAALAKNRFGSTTQSQARGKLDTNFELVCKAIKALAEMRENPKNRAKKIPSVEVYTVGFQVPNDQVKEDLQECASNPELTGYKYFINADNEEELKGAFETIGARLKTMYLSK